MRKKTIKNGQYNIIINSKKAMMIEDTKNDRTIFIDDSTNEELIFLDEILLHDNTVRGKNGS